MSSGHQFPTTLRQPDIDAVRHLYPVPVTAVNDQYQMTQGGVLTVPAPGLMANDTYPPGATIEFLPPFPLGGLTNVAPYNGGFILDMSLNPSFAGPLLLQYIIHSTSGDSNAASVTVQVNPAPSALLQISGGNNQVGAPTGILPNAVSVLATDQFGNPVGQVPVTFRVTSGGGCVSGSPTGTHCQSELATLTNGTSGPLPGKAGVFWKLGALAGLQSLEVVSPGLATITFTASAAMPHADQITYAVERAVGNGIIRGVIKTNAKLGILTQADILNWDLAIDANGDGSFARLLGPESGNNSALTFVSPALEATEDALTFDFALQTVNHVVQFITPDSQSVWQLQAGIPFQDELIRESLSPATIQSHAARPPAKQVIATMIVP